MRIAEIEVGRRYAAVRYFDRRVHSRVTESMRLEQGEWEAAWSSLGCVCVLGVRVQVPGYRRPGVRVQWLSCDTMQARGAPEAIAAVKVLLPWEEWDHRYHAHVDAMLELERTRREQAEQRRAAEAERNARDWMEREFQTARQDIIDVMTLYDFQAHEWVPADDKVRELVERRNPEGNPYLEST